MGLRELQDTCKLLGPMYSIQKIDGVESIYREFGNAFEFEVTGFFGAKEMTINLWQRKPHIELLAIYTGITDPEVLADTLGYLAFKYQNHQEKIQVEREDPAQ